MKIPEKDQKLIVAYWRENGMAKTMIHFGRGRKTVLKVLAAADEPKRKTGRPEVEV